jgi:uncharacterized protein YeaO (DUF488 family)
MDIIKLGLVAGEVLSKALDQLPTHDQRQLNEFFKFLDKYHEEIRRKDADFDDLLAWHSRHKLLLDTVIAEIARTRKK